MDLRMIDLAKLNTATKYPSIPTYHALGDRGALLEDGGIALGDDFIATEKVDGTNTRIILTADSQFLIGSREELLHARGDLVYNPALGIVDATREIAEHVVAQADLAIPSDAFLVLYGETFGGKITAMSKQYTGRRSVGFRAFDACVVPQTILAQDRAAISGWRDQGGQEFKNEALLSELADRCGVKLTPRIAVTGALPTGTHDTFNWLRNNINRTQVALDDDAKMEPEGLVLRTPDRSVIAKIRFQDYARHVKRTPRPH